MSAHQPERFQPRMTAAEAQRNRPSVQYRPALSIDGNKWVALYGENLQEGVAGSGNSPEAAMLDFDRQWYKPLSQKYLAALKAKKDAEAGKFVVKLPPERFADAAQLIAKTRERERTRIIRVVLTAAVLSFFAGFWVGHPTWFK